MDDFRLIYPQSLGLFPLPYSFILLPYIENWESCINSVIKLELSDIPEEWTFVKYIAEGNVKDAVENIERFQSGDIREYNLAVIGRDEEHIRALKGRLKDQLLKDLLTLLLSLNEGRHFLFETKRGDINSLIFFVNALISVGIGDRSEALSMLDSALKEIGDASPIFKAYILFKKGSIVRDQKGDSYHLISLFEDVINTLRETQANWLKGEIHFQLGSMYSTFGNLTEAVRNFDRALSYIDKEKDPYTWALIQNNKGLTYLSIPAQEVEDQFRLAMGVQSIKKALEVFAKDRYPDEWASATLNYANALQYLPSGNPIKNLLKAVELYEEVMEYRKRSGDREGYARVLANMGNALAHLGRLEEAKEKLTEARTIFAGLNMYEEVEAINGILDEIKTVEVSEGGNSEG